MISFAGLQFLSDNISKMHFDTSFIPRAFDKCFKFGNMATQEASFAQFKVWECGAIAVIFFLSPHITLQAMLILMTAALFISLGAFLLLTIFVEKSSPVRS